MEYPELLKFTKNIPLVMKTKFDYKNNSYVKIGGGYGLLYYGFVRKTP